MKREHRINLIGFIWLALVFFAFTAFFMLEGIGRVTREYSYNIGFGMTGLILIGCLYLTVLFDDTFFGKRAHLWAVLLITISGEIISSGIVWMARSVPVLNYLEDPFCIVYAALAYIEAGIFYFYCLEYFKVKESKYKVAGVCLAVICTVLFALTVYFVVAKERMQIADYGTIIAVLPGKSALRLVAAAVSRFMAAWVAFNQPLKNSDKVFFLVGPLIPVLIGILELIVPSISIFDTVSVIALLLLYMNASIRKSEVLAKTQAELTDQKVNLMISQIQPHFIFNALNTICYLCRKDPRAAEKATSQFAAYLRTNIDSLSKTGLIPFSKEMEHVKTYVTLEQMRFKEKLEVIYELNCTDFKIPQLTLQPLVENAVKHGVCERDEGGVVKISSYKDEEEGFFVVKILDNGVGFDQTAPKEKEDDRVHVGISNVKGRIETMCQGSLEVYSIPDKGTLATIKLPIKEK